MISDLNGQDSDLKRHKKEFLRIAHRAVKMGLQSSTGGNISMRWGEQFLVKSTGTSLYGLKGSDICAIDINGRPIEGIKKPTKEIHLHLGIYRRRKDVSGIVHYHAPFLTAYAVKGIPLPLLTVHAKRTLGEIPIVPEAPDGSEELAGQVASAFMDREVRVILLAAHGLVAVGKTLSEAENMAELAEETAKTSLLARLLDMNPSR